METKDLQQNIAAVNKQIALKQKEREDCLEKLKKLILELVETNMKTDFNYREEIGKLTSIKNDFNFALNEQKDLDKRMKNTKVLLGTVNGPEGEKGLCGVQGPSGPSGPRGSHSWSNEIPYHFYCQAQNELVNKRIHKAKRELTFEYIMSELIQYVTNEQYIREK